MPCRSYSNLVSLLSALGFLGGLIGATQFAQIKRNAREAEHRRRLLKERAKADELQRKLDALEKPKAVLSDKEISFKKNPAKWFKNLEDVLESLND